MFIRARPQDYVESHYLINTDQIVYMWNCQLEYRYGPKKGTKGEVGLYIMFSNNEGVPFQALSVEKMVNILAQNHRDAIVSALPEDEPSIDWSPGPGILTPVETGNNFGENR